MSTDHCPLHARRGRVRHAFTVIELLVTLSIIGLLISLILPAVLRTTESARRLECATRLGQLAKGAATFESSHQSLPTSNFVVWSPALPGMQSPWVPLLPFIDQASAFRDINLQESGAGAYPAPPGSRLNGKMFKLNIATFVCPSDRTLPGGCNYRMCLGISPRGLQRQTLRGASYAIGRLGAKAPLSNITDGLSQTVLYSEKIAGDGDDASFSVVKDAFFAGFTSAQTDPDGFVAHCQSSWPSSSAHFSFGGATWFFSGNAYTWFNNVLVPNSKMPDCAVTSLNLAVAATTARSWHGGGVNAAFADGSCRFTSESIDIAVWRALGTRAGRETVSAW